MTRRSAVIAALVSAAVVLLGGASTWASGDAPGVVADQRIGVSGFAVAPGLTTAGIVAVAAGLMLTLAGPIAGRIAAAVLVLAGAAAAALTLLADPTAALTDVAAATVGAPRIDGEVTPGALRWVSLLGAIAVIAVGLWTFVVVPRWPRVGRRFERGGTPRADAARTSASPGGAHAARVQAIDDWEAIERGEDPTVDPEPPR